MDTTTSLEPGDIVFLEVNSNIGSTHYRQYGEVILYGRHGRPAPSGNVYVKWNNDKMVTHLSSKRLRLVAKA